MNEPLYLDDLRKRLTELKRYESAITKLEIRKEVIRTQIRQWLEINKLPEYETFDSEDDLFYRIKETIQVRNNVDTKSMRVKYPDIVAAFTNKNEIKVFTCQPVKTASANNKSMPDAPSGKIKE